MEYISRAQSGLRSPRRRDRIGTVLGIGVHYTYRPRGSKDHARCDDDVREVQRYHMDVKNWSDGAYSFLVCPHGTIYELRGWGIRTAANGTNWGNEHFHAVCVISDGMITDAAEHATDRVIAQHNKVYKVNEVKGHRDFKATSCPGDEIYNKIVKNREPAPAPAPTPTPTRRITVQISMPELRRGVDGDHVEALQSLLVYKGGQKIAIDGDFGPATHDAVLNWQRFFGLGADGIVGEKTWATLLELPL